MRTIKKFLVLFLVIGALNLNCSSNDDNDDKDDPDFFVKFTVDGSTYTYTKGETAEEDAKCKYDEAKQLVTAVASKNGLVNNDDTTPDSLFLYLYNVPDQNAYDTFTGTYQLVTAANGSDHMYFTLTDGSHCNTNDNQKMEITITKNTTKYLKGTFAGVIINESVNPNVNLTVTDGSFILKKVQ